MSLMLGPGPFGHRPAALFNRELPDRQGLLFLEPAPRRIRGIAAGTTVVDSRNARLLYEHGSLPVYLFPEAEVRMELLEKSDKRTRSDNKGEARWWDLRIGETAIEHAAWTYPDPPGEAGFLTGLVGLRWGAMDEWYEEDELAIVHARDPYHRVDALETSRHVKVSVNGEVVAETTRARVIFETGLPPRWYIPSEDVRVDLLEPTPTRTGCAYKGFASYFTVTAGGAVEEDLVWTYEEPRREAAPVAGYLAFFNERVDIELDGELQERPLTPWSPEWKEQAPESSLEGEG
jgi:uncharacterized protein (DUF427 family)